VATTLLQFRDQVRDRADLVADNFVLDATLTTWINKSIAELYDLLIQASEDWYLASAPVTVNSGGVSFPVPTGMIRWRGLDRRIGGTDYTHVKKGVFRERLTYTEPRYILAGGTVYIYPTTSAPGTYLQWYVPVFTPLAADGDTFDGINGWEEYVIVDVAIKCRVKGEEDASDLFTAKAIQRARIQTMAASRDGSEAPRITDVHADDLNDADSW